MDPTPSDEDLIEGLQEFADEVDSVPTVRGMREDGPFSPHYYKESFGTWNDALRAADIQPTHGIEPDVDRGTLLEELQRVDEITDRPPRRVDVDEYGEYEYSLYDEEFESFVHALEEAGIDPDEKQYRFSSIETPEEKKGSANVEMLRNHGPLPSSELPQGRSTKDRQRGMWKFSMSSGSTQPADAMYYLNDEHAPELVLRRFFRHNPHVLEYRDPHGIKIAIKNHQPSWKDIGREVVDELVEEGFVPKASFENLVVVRTHQSEPLEYCFERSVSSEVDIADLPVDDVKSEGVRPVWGFPREQEDIWRLLSERDEIAFSTRSGVITHYVPMVETVENHDVMTDLWIEYENGVRSGGIERPWPYLVLGAELRETSLPQKELFETVDVSPDGEPVQLLDESDLDPLVNRYGTLETYLRNREQSGETASQDFALGEGASIEEVTEVLTDLALEDIDSSEADSLLGDVDRDVIEAAFREAVRGTYSCCACCGRQFESPDGSIDLHAVRVLPESEGGPPVVQNGIALCSQHRWAFEHGWLEISEDYRVTLADRPDLAGFSTFQPLDGRPLELPDDSELRPATRYIRQRNQ